MNLIHLTGLLLFTIFFSITVYIQQFSDAGCKPIEYNQTGADVNFSPQQEKNNPPDVKIISPQDSSLFEWDALIPFNIAVSDPEDGESKYGEIPGNEVYLQITYVSDREEAKRYIKHISETNRDPTGLALLRASDCLACHAPETRLVGPSFSELAGLYQRDAATLKMLAKRVIEGSEGIWGNAIMPPQPQLTEEEAQKVVEYILELGKNKNQSVSRGTRGTFRTRKKPEGKKNKGLYVLTASYVDHGIEDFPETRKRDQHTILLFNR